MIRILFIIELSLLPHILIFNTTCALENVRHVIKLTHELNLRFGLPYLIKFILIMFIGYMYYTSTID